MNHRKGIKMQDRMNDKNIDKFPIGMAYVPWQKFEKLYDDLYVVWDYDRKAGNKAAHEFMHSKEKGLLANLSLWFNMSDEYFNGLVTYGEYKRVRKALDACLHSLTLENQKKGGAA